MRRSANNEKAHSKKVGKTMVVRVQDEYWATKSPDVEPPLRNVKRTDSGKEVPQTEPTTSKMMTKEAPKGSEAPRTDAKQGVVLSQEAPTRSEAPGTKGGDDKASDRIIVIL